MSTAVVRGEGVERILTAGVAPDATPFMRGRLDQSHTVGNEGAGRVVAAGTSAAAQAILGRMVAVRSGAT